MFGGRSEGGGTEPRPRTPTPIRQPCRGAPNPSPLNDAFKRNEIVFACRSECSAVDTIVQLFCESGLSQIAEAVRIMLNEAMRIVRSRAIEAEPFLRTERRKRYANGFKPKTINPRLGAIPLDAPQTRDAGFYPSAPGKGIRRERAPKL